MKITAPFILALLLGGMRLQAQAFTYQWSATNSPPNSYRFDDVYFLNADTGWAVNFAYGLDDGYLMGTTNGGTTWQLLWDSLGLSLRDVGFTDALNGWAGTLEEGGSPQESGILYHTSDGGANWDSVPNLPGPRPAGICGMQVVNDSTVYAVGRYFGPAGFYKTTNNGQTWSYTNCSNVAGGLVDLHFFNPDTGYAIGTSSPNYLSGNGRIIYTTDAGNTWSIVHTSAHTNEICWKISFPSRQVGYVSLQAFANSGWQYFLKTIDGGATWSDLNISTAGGPSGSYNIQGIGFINEQVGWVGGGGSNYHTTDGGVTWTVQSWGETLNRFRFLNDSVAYAAGKKVYRMSRLAVGLDDALPNGFDLLQNHPNPFSDFTVIEYNLPVAHEVQISLFDLMGKKVADLVNEHAAAGNHRLIWSVNGIADGIYFYTMRIGDDSMTRKLVINR